MNLRNVIGVLFLLMALFVPTTAAQDSDQVVPDLEIIVLLDESLSMHVETDPDDRRGAAVELFINALSVDRSSADYRTAIVTFGTDARLIGNGFVSIKNDLEREALLNSLRTERPNRFGWTNVLAAMEIANDLLDDHRPGYKPIIVLITDGKPETPEANDETPEELAAFTEAVTQYGITEFQDVGYEGELCPSSASGTPIYTVAMRNSEAAATYTQEERELWQGISVATGGGYEEILPNSPLEFQSRLQTVFFDLLRDWTCLQVADTFFTPVPSAQGFVVTPNQSTVFLQVATSDPSVTVEITDANGDVVSAEDFNVDFRTTPDGLNQSWGITRPDDKQGWGGQWSVNFEGGDNTFAQFTPYFISDDIRFKIDQPVASILPSGAPLAIRATVIDDAGEPYDAGLIGSPRVEIVDAGGGLIAAQDVTVNQFGEIEAFVPPLTLGSYDILFQAEVLFEEQSVPIEQKKQIDIATLPYLMVRNPIGGSFFNFGQDVTVETAVMIGGQPLTDTSVNNAVAVELIDKSNNSVVERFELEPMEDLPSNFVGTIPAQETPGEYELRFELSSQPAGGQPYLAPQAVAKINVDPPPPTATPTPTFTPTPTPTPTSTPTSTSTPTPTATPRPPLIDQADIPDWAFLLCGLLILVPLVGLVLVLFFRNRPNLEGVYLEDTSHAGNDILFGASYFGTTAQIYSHEGDPIAKLKVSPGGDGIRFEVQDLDPEAELFHGEFPVDMGEAFYPSHNDLIRIGNVTLRFDNEADVLGDEFDY